jgi:type III pantothenate kinase
MLLAFDIGNTDTKIGFFARGPAGGLALRRDWRVGTQRQRTADEFGMLIATLLRSAEIAVADISAVVVSSVVPQSDPQLTNACMQYLGHEPVFFSAATQTLIDVTTERPKELGSDMLAAALAAREAYGTPLIVLGFGTATTFTAVSREGELLGTAIAPGIRISIDALVERTAKLPQIALDAPNGPIGRDTVSAMQAGIIFGFVGQAEGLIARMRHAIGDDASVVATGGLAHVIAKHTAAIDAVEPHLVLQGLRIFYEHTAAAKGVQIARTGP